MKPSLSLLAMLMLPVAAHGAPTDIAQSPLLNIAGSGVVKPNLMVLYDNSGSMARTYTPDFIQQTKVCRSSSTLALGQRNCQVGDPPFNAAQFNKQYYNPRTSYKPPVKADGTSWPSMTASATSSWTNVPTDKYGVNELALRAPNPNDPGATVTSTNLVTGFPDIKWCSGSTCVTNAATYSYPDATYKTATAIVTNPYYYDINVAEHCSDKALKNCEPTEIGAAPTLALPYPARVRYCTTKELTNCQAKYLDTHTFPRFSNEAGGKISYGSVTFDSVSGNTSRTLTSLKVAGVVVTNAAVVAPTGLNDATKLNIFVTGVAQSIIAKNGLPAQFTACVKTPTVSSVPACSSFGLLVGNSQVAVIPVTCNAGNTTKEIGDACNLVLDNSREGDAISLQSTTGVTGPTVAVMAGNAVFTRVDIIASRDSYPRGSERVDCAALTHCTYAEEMTNFANWYAYYKTRNQMMKTAVGMAFAPIGEKYNVGLVSLSVAADEGEMNTPKPFTGTARTTWYKELYEMDGNESTPTRAGLHSIGKMYANIGKYVKTAGQEVVKYPCQQNFTFVTTDGYWNGDAPGSEVVNNDNAENPARFCTKAGGCVQDNSTGVSLADVALYWYNGGSATTTSSLRPTLEDMSKDGLVPGEPGENRRLHMNTFTLGLGIDGLMTYEKDYKDNPDEDGDYIKVLNRVSTGCPWTSGEWQWPDPKTTSTSDQQSRVDDLWHAAVNGRGQYFSAAEPAEVVESLTTALLNIESKLGAAAAAATSTPNISLQDNDIFSDTFTTVKWYGELTNRKINTVTGNVEPTKLWNSSDKVGQKVADLADTRVIKMLNTATGALKNFKFSEMTTEEQAWFKNKCAILFQCTSMTPAEQLLANSGDNMVNWLRGQQKYADNTIFRQYASTTAVAGSTATLPIILGDIASSKPAFMREPRLGYTLSGYPAFITANKNRQATVFVGANDGMLHAFNAATGEEMWAYAPRITMKKLHKQASTTYAGNHQYSVDGSPELSDVMINGVWKSVLVSGLNGGGRGYFALDVTDPTNPKALWELCADPTICSGTGSKLEPELGLTFGNPQFGKWNDKWVVFLTSGYNNIPGTDGVPGGTGNGFLFIVDVATGEVLKKTATIASGATAGDTTTPSGLAKISAVNTNPNVDPVITHIYGGDNLGQMWRFDLATTVGSVGVSRMGNSGPGQPITTRPDITTCKVNTVVDGVSTPGTKRIVVYGTGRLLDVPDLTTSGVQSIYAVKDSAGDITPWKFKMVEQKLTKIGSSNSYEITKNAVDLSTENGWFVNLDKNLRERVNLDPRIVSGSVTVVTNIPDASTSCTVGGSSKVYRLDVCTGSYLNNSSTVKLDGKIVAGETLSANAAAVGFIMVRLPTGVIKMITTTADGGTETDVGPTTLSHGTRKAGWRRVTN